MKAKLIKIEEGYELLTQGFLKGSTNHELIDSLNVEEGNIRYKLSLKNCQAIECGYDSGGIKRKVFDGFDGQPGSFTVAAVERTIQIMTELMGDKKFNEDDMSKAWSEGYHRKVDELNGNGLRYFDKFIQSLQKTEWYVEIEMEEYEPLYGEGSTLRPKLDQDWCLILKRI